MLIYVYHLNWGKAVEAATSRAITSAALAIRETNPTSAILHNKSAFRRLLMTRAAVFILCGGVTLASLVILVLVPLPDPMHMSHHLDSSASSGLSANVSMAVRIVNRHY